MLNVALSLRYYHSVNSSISVMLLTYSVCLSVPLLGNISDQGISSSADRYSVSFHVISCTTNIYIRTDTCRVSQEMACNIGAHLSAVSGYFNHRISMHEEIENKFAVGRESCQLVRYVLLVIGVIIKEN